MSDVTTNKLAEDLKILKNDLGALVKTTGAAIAELRKPIEEKIAAGRKALAERRAARWQHASESSETESSRSFERAWVAVAIATGIGVALGLLLRRRK